MTTVDQTPPSAEPASALSPILAALEPVRVALLDDATWEAARIVSDARSQADAAIETVEVDIAEQVRQAQGRGQASFDAHRRQILAQTRKHARTLEMSAREAARQQLVARLYEDVLDVRNDPRYPQLLDRLESVVTNQLGPDTVIERDPPNAGGVIGRFGDRTVDYTLVRLAARALDAAGEAVATLWS